MSYIMTINDYGMKNTRVAMSIRIFIFSQPSFIKFGSFLMLPMLVKYKNACDFFWKVSNNEFHFRFAPYTMLLVKKL